MYNTLITASWFSSKISTV